MPPILLFFAIVITILTQVLEWLYSLNIFVGIIHLDNETYKPKKQQTTIIFKRTPLTGTYLLICFIEQSKIGTLNR